VWRRQNTEWTSLWLLVHVGSSDPVLLAIAVRTLWLQHCTRGQSHLGKAGPATPCHQDVSPCAPHYLSLNLLSSRFWTMSLCLWVWWLVTVGTLTLTWLPTELLDIKVENPFFNTASQVTGQGPWPVRWCGQMCRVPWTFFLPGADMQSTKISSATDLWNSKMVNASVSSSRSQEE
jgi:hypothetical protein